MILRSLLIEAPPYRRDITSVRLCVCVCVCVCDQSFLALYGSSCLHACVRMCGLVLRQIYGFYKYICICMYISIYMYIYISGVCLWSVLTRELCMQTHALASTHLAKTVSLCYSYDGRIQNRILSNIQKLPFVLQLLYIHIYEYA